MFENFDWNYHFSQSHKTLRNHSERFFYADWIWRGEKIDLKMVQCWIWMIIFRACHRKVPNLNVKFSKLLLNLPEIILNHF